jgi:acyl carrier protein
MAFNQALKTFIQEKLAGQSHAAELDDDESLIERGLIDSMGLMHMVLFIEEQTGVRVPDEEILPGNFASLSSIERMVERLRMRSRT